MERNEATSMTEAERLARALDAHIEGPDRLTMEDAIALRDELRRLSSDARMLDWLLRKVSGKEFRALGVIYSAGADRAAIDQAMKDTP